jgi:feruloyl esterase
VLFLEKKISMKAAGIAIPFAAMLGACGGGDDSSPPPVASIPQLTPATGATLGSCAGLATSLSLPNTTITSATPVAAGALTVAGTDTIPAHCLVSGEMFKRIGPIDGVQYAIKFEMRLPNEWNGRFFYQANGGKDGTVVTASGGMPGGGPTTTGLSQGFAVLSSDMGHENSLYPLGGVPFGLDPQARLDFGYNAVAQLTPMAKNLIKAAYGKGPDRSYMVGCSNGGRHAMVAAARFADMYDGILAGDPGFNLPKASLAQVYGVQQYASISSNDPGTGKADINTAFSTADLNLLSSKVLEKCDALDGAKDGIVSDLHSCQTAFNLNTAVATCTGAPDGTCLTADQKKVLGNVFAGVKNSSGTPLYAPFPFDAGVNGSGWRTWKFAYAVQPIRDPGGLAFIYITPPLSVAEFGTSATAGLDYALGFNFDTDAPKIYASNSIYTQSSIQFDTPPDPTNLSTLKNRGAKMIVYQGGSDPVFSIDDTINWYQGLTAANNGDATNFVRMFEVPGMNHCNGGPSVDQFDLLTPLVNWVEKGVAPDAVKSTARGPGANVVNTEVPADWAANRSRPLCAYPKVAKYKGSGSLEDAASFSCT